MVSLLQKIYRFDTDHPVRLSETEERRIKSALHHWKEARRYRIMGTTYDEIASELNVTKRAFNAYFTVHLQEDFRTWRTRLRIEDAKTLLLHEPDLSCSKVGQIVGFSDRSNFAHQFQRHVGCTPLQWREKHLK